MKLRRALVTAAATAAIAPIALLSAPAAFADGTPGAAAESVATTPSAPESEPGSQSPATPPGTGSPSPSDTESESASASDSSSPATTGKNSSQSASTSTASPDASDSGEPGDDECTDYEDSPGTLAELRDLPSKVVAGSGWHGFTFRVSNKTDEAFESVSAELYAFSFAYDEDATETSKYLHVQWSDGSGWHDIETDIADENFEPFADAGPLEPGEHADLKLRLKVDAKAPTGIGGSMAFATSVNAEGVCGYSVPEDQEYRFEILAADTEPGKVPPATSEPKPSATASNTPAPQSSSTPLDGSLASTGSNSMLPAVGLVGGIAVVAGAGVVYSVRRRKVSDEA